MYLLVYYTSFNIDVNTIVEISEMEKPDNDPPLRRHPIRSHMVFILTWIFDHFK